MLTCTIFFQWMVPWSLHCHYHYGNVMISLTQVSLLTQKESTEDRLRHYGWLLDFLLSPFHPFPGSHSVCSFPPESAGTLLHQLPGRIVEWEQSEVKEGEIK